MNGRHFIERTACPACDGVDTSWRYAVPFADPVMRAYLDRFYAPQGGIEFALLEDAQWVVRECAGCGLIFQRDIGDDVLMERLYEQWIDADAARERHRRHYGLPHYVRTAQHVASVIARTGQRPAGLALLDFGAGWSDWAAMAGAFGCDAFGVELSPRRAARARQRGVTVITEGELGSPRFDFINAFHVLEHLPQPFETLSRLARSLKPGGMLRVAVPDVDHIRARLADLDRGATPELLERLNAVAPLEHINGFNPRSLARMARRAGLSASNLPLLPDFPAGHRGDGLVPYLRTVAAAIARPLRNDAGLSATEMYFVPDR